MSPEFDLLKPSLNDIMHSLEKFYMVTLMNRDGSILSVNKNLLEISDWTPKRILGKTFWEMFPDTEQAQVQAHSIWNHVASGKNWFGTVEKMTRSNNSYYVNMLAIPLLNTGGALQSVTLLELDITADIELREKLQQIAYIDFETGLMSRHRLEIVVNEEIQSKKHFSFVYLTIDHYYTLKDSHPHEAEKEIIKSFTNRLKRFFQDNPIARVGVNEFVILSPFGEWYVQGFHAFLEQQPIYIDHIALPLTVSGGIVRYPEDQQTFTHLFKAALTTTKEVIENGGGKITSLSADSHKILNRKANIDRKMRTVLEHNQLQVVYQPQFDVALGKINLYEALVRWEDDELGFITPDELIPIAEENGMIHAVGAFVLEQAANLGSEWNDKGHCLHISVNTSVREFTDTRMKQKIIEIIKTTSCPPDQLQLEITEKFAFQAEEEHSIIHQMQELQELGIEFTLDDFGTGYASFRYMQSLPITKIKIDKVFIQSILTQPKTQQLVDGMIRFGKSMGMYIVAEGIETKEQYDLLIEMGVDALQGYYIGRPQKASDIG